MVPTVGARDNSGLKRFLPNKRKAVALAAAAILAVAAVTAVIAQSGGGFGLSFRTVNQGGVASTGGRFSLPAANGIIEGKDQP